MAKNNFTTLQTNNFTWSPKVKIRTTETSEFFVEPRWNYFALLVVASVFVDFLLSVFHMIMVRIGSYQQKFCLTANFLYLVQILSHTYKPHSF
jgi:hypothetical protein